MWCSNKLNFIVVAVSISAVGALIAPLSGWAQMAGNMQYTERSDGGVDISFGNGCYLWYNRYARRGGSSGGCTERQYARADEAAKSYLNISGTDDGAGSVAPEDQMQKYCQGEASAELGVNPRDISTRPPERSKSGRFIVWGQSPPYGSNVTTFVCGFDDRGRFQKVEIKSQPNNTGGSSSSDSISVAQMPKYCQGEASATLGTRPAYISTQRAVDGTNGYVVYGQSPPEGGPNTTAFECNFDWNGVFRGVVVTSRPGSGWNTPGNASPDNGQLPRTAENRCREVFGVQANITEVSPLRPGFWEVILESRSGPRMAACTVSNRGDIQNWVEMN